MAHHDAAVEVGRGQQQAGDELAGGGRVDGHLAAGDPAGAVHGQRQPAARARRRCRRRARAAPSSSGASGRCRAARVAVEGDRAVGERRRPAAGTASPCRRGRRRRGPGRAAGRGRTTHRSSSTVDTCAPMRAQAGGHQLGVAGPQRAAQRAGADRDRAEHQGPGGHRLGAGQADGRPHRAGGGRRGPGRRGSRSRSPRVQSAGRAGAVAIGRAAAPDVPGRPRLRVMAHVRAVRDHPQPADLSALFEALRRDRRRPGARLQRRADRPGADRAGLRSAGGRVLSRRPVGPGAGWAPDTRGGARMINARAETVATSRGVRAVVRRGAAAWCRPTAGTSGCARPDGGKQAVLHDPPDGAGGRSPASGRCGATATTGCSRAASSPLPARRRSGAGARPDAAGAAADAVGRLADAATEPAAAAGAAAAGVRWPASRSGRSGPAVGDVRNDGPTLVERVAAPPLGAPHEDRVDLTLF